MRVRTHESNNQWRLVLSSALTKDSIFDDGFITGKWSQARLSCTRIVVRICSWEFSLISNKMHKLCTIHSSRMTNIQWCLFYADVITALQVFGVQAFIMFMLISIHIKRCDYIFLFFAGHVGGWKERITEEQSKIFDKKIEETFKDTGLTFDFELQKKE